jgi:hypothetical protein
MGNVSGEDFATAIALNELRPKPVATSCHMTGAVFLRIMCNDPYND